MNFSETFAYIPLFGASAEAVVVFVLLLVIRIKSKARVSALTLLSVLVGAVALCAAAIMSFSRSAPALAVVAYALCVALFFCIPYCAVLCTFEPKRIEKLVPPEKNAASPVDESVPLSPELSAGQKLAELSEEDRSMLEVSHSFMTHASSAFTTDTGMVELLDYINKTIKSAINADGAAVLMVDDFDDVIAVKAFDGDFPPPYQLPGDMPHKPVRVATNFKFALFPLRDNIFGEIATAGKAELITNPELDDRIYQNGPEEFLKCGSYIIVPMKAADSVIGVTAFARTHGNPVFTEEDFKTASTLSDFASAAIQNVITVKDAIEHSEITKEADIASRIQNMLHPAKLPVVPGTQTGVVWNPSEGVGGDYYDIVVSRRDRVSYIMSDIAGKGINSIVVMIMLRAMLRLVVNTTQSAGKILSWVNRGIAGESFSTDHFGSCALINYDPKKKQLELATGGDIPVLYYDATHDTIEQLTERTEPIGVEKNTEYADIVRPVSSGDIFVTYTDGLVEALNADGEQYSKQTLMQLIKANHAASGKDIADIIRADVKKFSGDAVQHDDQTLLVVKMQ